MMPAALNKREYITNLHLETEESFRRVYEKYRNPLAYFAARLLPAEESPEDVIQEAFVKLWQRRDTFRNQDAIKAFLYITVRNHCLNLRKHIQVIRRFGFTLTKEEEDMEMAEGVIESEVLEKVYQALQELPEGCREVLQLGYFKGLKNKEVAAYLQVSVNTVKTQKKRGLHLLRTVLKTIPFWFLFFFL